MLGFQSELERDSLQEPFFNEDDENDAEQERSGRESPAVEELCECGKCGLMLTEKDCRCCHEVALHYSSDDIRDGSRNFASSKLKIFATKRFTASRC